MYSSKVNLPAALNDPRLAKRESDFFTKTWGLDFAETEVMPSFYLPNISRELFGPYLQETAQVTSRPAPGSCSSEDADHVTRVRFSTHTFSALDMSCDSAPSDVSSCCCFEPVASLCNDSAGSSCERHVTSLFSLFEAVLWETCEHDISKTTNKLMLVCFLLSYVSLSVFLFLQFYSFT